MGTRNLTAVYIDGEYKVAQYGQWDGYPGGQGITCLEFLRDRCDMPKFKANVRKATFLTPEEYNSILKKYGMDEDGMISVRDYDRLKIDMPELSRDTGAEILDIIQSREEGVKLENSISFAADSIFCEWAWVIDLDANTFEAYEGFNKEPLTPEDRFYFLKEYEEDGDSGVKRVAMWHLDDLPTNDDFISAFKQEEEE